MKRLVIAASVFFFALNASALSVTNPLYMPAAGSFMSDTKLDIDGWRSGDDSKFYTLTERVSINFTDAFQLGAYLGYGKADFSHEEISDENGFTNPGVFAYYRLVNSGLIFDIGAEAELGAFDKIVNEDDKFGAMARVGADLEVFSFGGDVKLQYVNPEFGDNREDAEVGAFAIFDIKDIFGIGAEGRYYSQDVFDNAFDSYELLGRVDINPLERNLGIVIFGGYTRDVELDLDGYKAGARFRVAF